MGKIPRKQREAQRQRAEIMSAAERRFSSRGFYQTTIRDVAKEAEFGVGTVYKFFSSKERLYLAVIENKMCELNESIKREVSAKSDTLEKIKAFIRMWLQFFDANRDFFRLLVSELDEQRFSVRKRLREKVFKRHRELTDFASQTFKDGIQKGLIRGYDPDVLAHAIGGITKGVIERKFVRGEPLEPKQDAEMIFEIFAYGVLKSKSSEKRRS